ncbi:MAG: carbon starvation CstA family protein [Opitutaceae bacterium]
MLPKTTSNGIIRILGWGAVIALGTGAIAILAFVRGEPVSSLWMVVAAVCVFAVSYRFHSAWLLARVLTLDDLRAPPSVVKGDKKDYVATPRWVVFGHHFAAIAGPGPLVGPVLAAQFGYLPGLLWMLIGATLGGAVHDSVILFCSIRRGGKSLGQMVKDEVGPFAGLVTLVGIVTIMVMILAVLALVVVKALTNSPWGLSTIAATIPIALVMGIAMRSAPRHLGWISVLGIAALLAAVWAGQYISGSRLEAFFTLSATQLAWTIIVYGMLSILPVWVLLAPRDYLSSFMKIGTVAALAAAIVILAPSLQMPAVTPFIDGSGPVFAGPVFPFCFITIACAAVSGFHSLIASGTTPKLISRERDIRTVAYGAMITEMCVGVMALIAACSMQPGEYFAVNMAGDPAAVVAKATSLGFPVTAPEMARLAASVGERTMIGRTGGAPTFALGMAHIFARVLRGRAAMALWYHFAIMFEAMFILTTIDAGTRVGRFLVQDFLGLAWKPFSNTRSLPATAMATVLFVGAWGWFLYQGVVDPLGGINSLWPIFGIANQLLAVIALAFGTTVLIKMNRKRYAWVTLLPLGWLLSVTMTAGWMKIFSDDPRLGFLSGARAAERAMAGASPAGASALAREILNARVDAAVTGFYLIMVVLIVLSSARVCFELIGGRSACRVREEPYIPIAPVGRTG